MSCNFNFGSALTSVADMINVARVVENVGVAAVSFSFSKINSFIVIII